MLPGVKILIPVTVQGSSMTTDLLEDGSNSKKLIRSNNIRSFSQFVPFSNTTTTSLSQSMLPNVISGVEAKAAAVATKYKTVKVNCNGVIQTLSVPQCTPTPQIQNCTDVNRSSGNHNPILSQFLTQPVILLSSKTDKNTNSLTSASPCSSGNSSNIYSVNGSFLTNRPPNGSAQTKVVNIPLYNYYNPGIVNQNSTNLVNPGWNDSKNGSADSVVPISHNPSINAVPTSLPVFLSSGRNSASRSIIPVSSPVAYTVISTAAYSNYIHTTATKPNKNTTTPHYVYPISNMITTSTISSANTVSKSSSVPLKKPATYVMPSSIDPTTVPIVPSLSNTEVSELKISSVFSLSKEKTTALPNMSPKRKEVPFKNYEVNAITDYDEEDDTRKICCGTLHKNRDRKLYLIHLDHGYSKLFYKLDHQDSKYYSANETSFVCKTQTARKRTSKLRKLSIKGDLKARNKVKKMKKIKKLHPRFSKKKTLEIVLRRINTGGKLSLSLGVLRMINPGRFKFPKKKHIIKIPPPMQVHSYCKPMSVSLRNPHKKTIKEAKSVQTLPNQQNVTPAQNEINTTDFCEDAFYVTSDNKIVKCTGSEAVSCTETIVLSDDYDSETTVSAVSPSYEAEFNFGKEVDEKSKTCDEKSNKETGTSELGSFPSWYNETDTQNGQNSMEPMKIFDVEEVVAIEEDIEDSEPDKHNFADPIDVPEVEAVSRENRIESLKDLLFEQTQKLDTIRKNRVEDSNSMVIGADQQN